MAILSIHGAASPVAGAIREAAQSTGASFEYLLTTAQLESNLDPAARASTSSAKGLYQFLDQTWLATMKQAGPALGLGRYANAIVQMPDGSYAVPDVGARAAVLKLRNDPTVSAKLAGIFSRSNAAKLATSLGRAPSDGELYIAHFLGADGAARLIATAASRPQAGAAAMFPTAAAANRTIFYDRAGHALTVSAVYDNLTNRYAVAHALAFEPHNANATATATATADPPAPDPGAVAQAYAAARKPVVLPEPINNRVHDSKPLFEAMFTDVPRKGLSPAVGRLWGAGKADPQQQGRPSGALDLFRDARPPHLRKSIGGKT